MYNDRDIKLLAHIKIEASLDTCEWMKKFQKIHDDLISGEIDDNDVPIEFIFLDKIERAKIGRSNCDIDYKKGQVVIEAHYNGNINFMVDLISHTQRYKDVQEKLGFQWTVVDTDEIPPKINSGAVVIDKDHIEHRNNNEDWLLEKMYGYPAPSL